MAASELPSELVPAAGSLRGKVLYIEDAETSMAVVEGMMQHFPGVQLLQATTGRQGVEMVRQERPDLVLLDMHLPDISGLEVVRILNQEISDRGLRVTILTGDKLSMDIIKAMSLGAFEYWIKPVELRVLASGLRRALGGRTAHPARHFPVR
ncbi:response regulator [Aquincola tertiaricarbonis]|uniref:Response regulator n=1 Tax=Aquincola tertiaricarbonis TaxID=391953 RepID=A0ABY4SFM8_AQUTE|nr:response regulator [Aquincola tertiaricarbonis]URI10707.1 response regulator [Aquincola tertiaricarbonis]